ncbi:MAG: hypothetical protein JO132_07185 [Streptosporangiaceae bacterium]|nr:hypothetical protein [Streptosporangiaceae bacterium]
MTGQAVDRLLVAGERVEAGRQAAQQRIVPALRGEGDPDASDRLAVPPADGGALVAAKRPDAVAGAEEREISGDHRVEQAAQVCLDPPLHRRLGLLGVGVVERAAAEQDPGPIRQADTAQRALLQPHPAQPGLAEPGHGTERGVLIVGRSIIGADAQQQERLHVDHPSAWR